MRHAVLALLFASSSCTLVARYKPATLVEKPVRVRARVLDDGLQVISDEPTNSSVVAIALSVGAGSAGDPVGRDGLAHLVEHLAFRAQLPGGYTVREAIEYSGVADYNAFTEVDTTTYFFTGTREMLPALVSIAASVLRGGVVDDATFNVERSVVDAERGTHVDHAGNTAWRRWIPEALYPAGHPSARTAIGTPQTLAAMTAQDVTAFRAQHYRPENATLAVSGGYDEAALAQALARFFPPLPSRVQRPPVVPPTREEPPVPPALRMVRRTAPVSGDELYVAWSLPTAFEVPGGTRAVADVASAAILRVSEEEERFIEDSWCHLAAARHTSYVACGLSLKRGVNPDKVLATVLSRYDELVDRARNAGPRLRAPEGGEREAPDLETARERARFRAQRAQYSGKFLVNEPFKPATMDANELRWVAGARARAVFVSAGGALEPTELAAKATLASSRSATAQFPVDAVLNVATTLGAARAESSELSNGLQVVVVPSKQFATTAVMLLLPGGTALAQPRGATTLGLAMGRQLVRDLGDAAQAGATWDFQLTDDSVTMTLQGAPENLESMLGWLRYKLAARWYVDDGVFKVARQFSADRLREATSTPQYERAAAFVRAVFGADHPYGHLEDLDQLMSLGSGETEQWLNRLYVPTGAALVVIGDVDVEVADRLVREQFADLKREPALVRPAPVAHLPARALVTHLRETTHVSVAWACPAPAVAQRDEALNALVAAWLDLQLTERLRHTAGISYGSGAGSERRWGGAGVITATRTVANERLDLVIKVLEEVALTRTVTRNELLNAAWDVLRARNARLELPGDVALLFARGARDGWPTTAPDQFAQTLVDLTPEQFVAALAACHQSRVYSFLGERTAIEAEAREAGLALPLELTTPAK